MQHPRSGLSDPQSAAIAWSHFRRLMRWMSLVALLAVLAALAYLRAGGGVLTLPMVVATVAGVGCAVMLAAALMLLAFLSSGSGHDEAATTPFEEDR